MELTTSRLVIVPAGIELLQAVIDRDYVMAGAVQQLTIPPTWPGNPDAVDGLPIHLGALRADPSEIPWRIRLVLLNRIAIGSINLKGPPRGGSVEIGWGIVPAMRRKGFAAEATAAVIGWLQAQPAIHRITATIDDANTASIRVADRVAMRKTAALHRDLPVYELTGWRA
ncbi:MAG TPA: GNAT family protein [Kofleriaceae bacterium]|nr:GNAT family protein [Kofleriaceae bacterium]